jgi:cytochrome c-type biogenesis protein
MTPQVTILAALFAGLVSFLSPCVLPLVPPYLVYLAGSSLERVSGDGTVSRARSETEISPLLYVS